MDPQNNSIYGAWLRAPSLRDKSKNRCSGYGGKEQIESQSSLYEEDDDVAKD